MYLSIITKWKAWFLRD